MSKRILVCGGRDYSDRAKVHEVLSLHVPPNAAVIQGGASGADALAREWSEENGRAVGTIRADWNKQGRAAGPIRNQRMLEEGKPVLAIAFPGGRGTADMVSRAKAAGVPVIEVEP